MEHKVKSIRPFVGSENFEVSRSFYRDLGFKENVIFHNMSYFESGGFGFYLQDYYLEDWISNTMIFMEVDDVPRFWNELQALNLTEKYDTIKLVPMRDNDWGRECFVHDPCGILWHFGEFYNKL